ncbi:MAG: VWA domain-containing protein [Flammeovirgaceae bacterium]
MVQFLTEYSLWWIIPCLLVGFGYAYLLYKKDAPWTKTVNRSLFGVRFVLISLICFLLLGPYSKLVKNYIEKPTFVLAIDNSQSLPLVNDQKVLDESLTAIAQLAKLLQEKDIEVDLKSFSTKPQVDSLNQLPFDAASTDLSGLLKGIQHQYENKNLAGVVLLSDGIYNQGISPNYTPYTMPVHTVGIGDTLPQIDVNLKTVYANKIAYLGNKFPLVAEIHNSGFEGKTAEVRLSRKGKVLERKRIEFPEESGIQTVQFLTSSEEKGIQHYTLQVSSLSGEFTTKNNYKNVYIDILDGREKILLVAAAPHPDIKAIRNAVEKNANYEFVTYIPSLVDQNKKQKINLNDKYDVVIFHQIPNLKGIGNDLLRRFQAKKTPMWFITGKSSNYNQVNQVNQVVRISASRQTDRVTPIFNSRFSRFTFTSENKTAMTKYPPVLVPFGRFKLRGNSETILYQRVGSIGTEKPLLVVGNVNDQKQAVLLGEGIWQWRLQEFANTQKHDAFDDVVAKIIQYLSTKEDKRKFRVYPTSNEFFDSEPIIFETEVYNDIYEKIYGQKVELKISNEKGETNSYNYVNSSAGFKYRVNGLEQGVYRYSASTQLEGKREVSSGQFTIKALEIESVNTTADFNLLRNLAKQTDGKFYLNTELSQLQNDLLATEHPKIIHSQEEFEEWLNLEWLLGLLVLLAAFEWFMRKFKGGY